MRRLCIVILLGLAACACGRTPEKASLPVDPAALEAYHQADKALLHAARQGVRMTMTTVDPDGTRREGFDEIITGSPNRMREVRTDYEAVGVGDIVCKQARGSAAPVCEESEFEPGLKELDDASVVRAKSTVTACGKATCRRVRIEETFTPWSEIEDAQMPAEEGRLVTVLLIRQDGLPYSLSQWQWSGADRVQEEAAYLFDYDAPVARIELPPEAKAVVPPKGK